MCKHWKNIFSTISSVEKTLDEENVIGYDAIILVVVFEWAYIINTASQ